MNLGVIIDALQHGRTVLLGVPRHNLWREAVDPIVDEAMRLQMQPYLSASQLTLRVKTGGTVRVILESRPDDSHGLSADVIAFPFGGGDEFRRALRNTLRHTTGGQEL